MRVPRDILKPALKLLERVAHISAFLAVPFNQEYLLSGDYKRLKTGSLANTACLTPEGVILLSKRKAHTVPMPSHVDAAETRSVNASHLPVGYGCCDVVQSVLVSKAACVPTNPQSKTRVNLPAPIGCALPSSDSAITLPTTHYQSKAGEGQQAVKFTACRFAKGDK
jgi:hypothetical protein